ncbi:MAG: cyclic AMP receptor protein, partial [Bdellovibrio sp.]
MTDLEQKRIFLIATANNNLADYLQQKISHKIRGSTIFVASDGLEALFKADNVFPHVLILDPNLAKMHAYDLADSLLRRKERLALIFLSPFPEQDHFVDEVVTGQVQYVDAINV